jgi:hypothetical protein
VFIESGSVSASLAPFCESSSWYLLLIGVMSEVEVSTCLLQCVRLLCTDCQGCVSVGLAPLSLSSCTPDIKTSGWLY